MTNEIFLLLYLIDVVGAINTSGGVALFLLLIALAITCLTADLVGRQSACITVELIFPYLLKQVTKQAQKLRGEGYGDKL